MNGFLQLHLMEAEDNCGKLYNYTFSNKSEMLNTVKHCTDVDILFNIGDSAELWVTLNAMGYNYNLIQDEAALFEVINFCQFINAYYFIKVNLKLYLIHSTQCN